jgi:hypothetical protein
VPNPATLKNSVNGQTRLAGVWSGGFLVQALLERRPQLVQTLARHGRHGDNGRLLKHRPLDRLSDFEGHQLQPIGILDQVDLRHGDHAAGDCQQVEDRQMLMGLGHHPFIGSHHHQRQVNAAHPGEHVLDEVAVTWHVHDPHLFLVFSQLHPGEAQVNRHLPLLFFFQAIGIDAGQGLNQR